MTDPAAAFCDDIEEPDVSHLITEDDEPVDNPFSEKQQRLLVESLQHSWSEGMRQGRPFVAFANVGLFFVPKNPAIVPDVQVSLDCELPDDLWAKKNRSYMTWVYGKPPEVVIEIVSNRRGGETDRKFKTYADQGVAYYVIYDPQRVYGTRQLRAYELHGRQYIQMMDPVWLSGALLGLKLWEGVYEDYEAIWIRWCDEQGELLRSGVEAVANAREDAEEAKVEAQRAKEDAKRAKEDAEQAKEDAERAIEEAKCERQRAEQLVARLKALGLEP